MPAPARTTAEEILQAARSIVAAGGADALTMQAVAARVGVRAPSLYKRIESRDRLLGLVVESAMDDLGGVLAEDAGPGAAGSGAEEPGERESDADRAGEPAEDLLGLLRSLRRRAHEQPALFQLPFGPLPEQARPSRDALLRSSAGVLRIAGQLAGAEHALEAARTITAWTFGFLSMELAGAFQLGGDSDAAFEFGARAILRAIASGDASGAPAGEG